MNGHPIFQDLDPINRIRLLEDNADKVIPEYTYDRVLSDDEMIENREMFSSNHIELAKLEDEKKALVERINDDIKRKKVVVKNLLYTIKTGREETREKVYEYRDHENNKVHLYNMHGDCIHTRPMNPDERERRLPFGSTKTA